MKTDETVVVIHLIAVKICIIAEGFVITAILAINIIIIIIIIIIIVIEKKEAGLLSLDFYYSEEKKNVNQTKISKSRQFSSPSPRPSSSVAFNFHWFRWQCIKTNNPFSWIFIAHGSNHTCFVCLMTHF